MSGRVPLTCLNKHTLSHTQLVDTTVEIANKVGAAEIASRVVDDLKDESEQYRKMVMDCLEKVCTACVGMTTRLVNCLAGLHIVIIALRQYCTYYLVCALWDRMLSM